MENNWDQDELNTEREVVGILENRILMLFFASADCDKCQEFVPVLNNFFKRLKDPVYIEYPKLLALVYVRSLSFVLFISLMHTCDCINSHSPCFIIHTFPISISPLQLGPIREAAGEIPQRAAQKDSVFGLRGPIQEVGGWREKNIFFYVFVNIFVCLTCLSVFLKLYEEIHQNTVKI